MKRITAILLLCCLLCGCFALAPASAAALSGDADGDGEVTVTDARLILRYAVNLEAPGTALRPNADVDGDGQITVSDARYALRAAVGLNDGFELILYRTAHQYNGCTADQLPRVDYLIENIYRSIDKWCCYYTLHDVFRPVLKAAGYKQERIDQIAPNIYEKERMAKAIKTTVNSELAPWQMALIRTAYVPSLLLDYYLRHPDYATCYVFREYYDDIIESALNKPSDNRGSYSPRVGDILFVTNKTSTYVDGIPTVDHTAQIIRLNGDGSFTCTDGCILPTKEGEKSRVMERRYIWSDARNTWVWDGNDIVQTLAIARPAL